MKNELLAIIETEIYGEYIKDIMDFRDVLNNTHESLPTYKEIKDFYKNPDSVEFSNNIDLNIHKNKKFINKEVLDKIQWIDSPELGGKKAFLNVIIDMNEKTGKIEERIYNERGTSLVLFEQYKDNNIISILTKEDLIKKMAENRYFNLKNLEQSENVLALFDGNDMVYWNRNLTDSCGFKEYYPSLDKKTVNSKQKISQQMNFEIVDNYFKTKLKMEEYGRYKCFFAEPGEINLYLNEYISWAYLSFTDYEKNKTNLKLVTRNNYV